jgi:hypothetical protein
MFGCVCEKRLRNSRKTLEFINGRSSVSKIATVATEIFVIFYNIFLFVVNYFNPVQFQLKVTNPDSTSTFQQKSTFCTKVAKLTLPKWFV